MAAFCNFNISDVVYFAVAKDNVTSAADEYA